MKAPFREDYLTLAEMNTILQRLIDKRGRLYRQMGELSYGTGHSRNKAQIQAIEKDCQLLSNEIIQRIDERNAFQAALRLKVKRDS